MEDFYNKLCLLLLEEYFGSIVQCIANNLFYGTKMLNAICYGTKLPMAKVNSNIATRYINLHLVWLVTCLFFSISNLPYKFSLFNFVLCIVTF